MGVCVPEELRRRGRGLPLVHPRARGALARRRGRRGDGGRAHLGLHAADPRRSAPTRSASAFVPPLARGERIGCFALTEPAPARTRARCIDARRARRRAAGGFAARSSGSRTASFGGTFLLFARTDPGDAVRARRLGVHRRHRPRRGHADGGEARAQLVAHERPRDRRGRRRRPAARRRRPRLPDRDGDARRRPDRHRRAGGRDRPGRVRRRARATRRSGRRSATRSPSSRRSSTSSRTCRWRSTRRGCSRYRAAWLKDQGRPHTEAGREGEALRLRDGAPPDGRGDPDARRLRLHEGVPGRALLPRREDDRDLRGHERDPAARDRARAARRPETCRGVPDEPVRLTRIYTRGGDARRDVARRRLARVEARSARARVRRGRRAELRASAGRRSRRRRARLDADPERALRPRRRPVACRSRRTTASCGSTRTAIDRLEADCDEANAPLPELRSFVLPGGTEAAARLHIARAACRRAEREVLAAARERAGEPARARLPEPAVATCSSSSRALRIAGGAEPLWKPGRRTLESHRIRFGL